MSKPNVMTPFSKEEMASELREILFVQASQIAHAGFKQVAVQFIGFEFEFSPVCTPTESDLARVDLTRFSASGYLSTAYDYAFQVGQSWAFSESDNHDIIAFGGGVTPEASYGDQSPYLSPDSRCRHVIDMATGRWNLECEDDRDLTIRHLALLAAMTEAAVRNSLSAEQIRTRGKPAALARDMALNWLKARKGFVETRREENQREFWSAHTRSLLAAAHLPAGIKTLLGELSLTPEALAEKSDVSAAVIAAFLAGQIDVSDLAPIERLGEALEVDVPYFVGQAVEAALRAKA